MPQNREAYSRYRLIDARLRKKPFPRLEELHSYVEENLGVTVSRRTMQLDLQEMRYSQGLGFYAPIVYNRAEKTYRYSKDDYSISTLPVSADELQGLDFAISILNQFKHLPAIKEFEDAIIKIASTVKLNKQARNENDYIQLERPFVVKGIEFVEPVIKAITEKRVLRFTYKKHDSREESLNYLQPYLIREAKNFWYVIGKRTNTKENKVVTFALDRIQDMRLTDEFFVEENIDRKNFFKNVVGVTVGAGKAEKVVLAFTTLQGKYIKTVPIHHSQKIVKETQNELRVSLDVVVNHELKMQILSYGEHVKVMQPKTLAKEMLTSAKNMVNQYNKT